MYYGYELNYGSDIEMSVNGVLYLVPDGTRL